MIQKIDTIALRNKILDLAFKGKLVKQDPNDEPASVLLEKIKQEKDKLIKDGKIKRDKNESIIYKGDDNHYYEKIGNTTTNITNAIPFEVPKNWVWVRSRTICLDIFSGRTPIYSKNESENIIIGQAANVGSKIDFTFAKFGESTFWEKMDEKYFLQYGDVLLNSLGNGTLGRCGVNLTTIKMLSDGHLIIFRTENLTTSLFIFRYLTLIRNEIENSAVGTTNQTFLKLSTVQDYLIPLPPLAEQQRIVEKIESLFAEIDKIEKAQDELDKLKEQTRQKVLDLAVRGKLVKQDPNDEPASVLLEKIEKEKKQLAKEGKIKRDKNESIIYKGDDKNYYEKIGNNVTDITDEIPFEIPDSWYFARIGELGTLGMGQTILTRQMIKNGIPVYSATISDTPLGYVDRNLAKKVLLASGDMVIPARGASIGYVTCIKENEATCTQTTIFYKPYRVELPKYLYYQFVSNKKYFFPISGTAQPQLTIANLEERIAALPPLAEQRRIINAVESLNELL